MINIGGILCSDDDAEESYEKNNIQATRRLTCAWNDRIALATAIMGGSTQNGVLTNLVAPLRYPDATFLRAEGIKIDGDGTKSIGPHGMVAYQWAHLNIRYGTPDVSLTSEDVGVLQLDVSSQVLMPSQSEPTFKWKSDNADLPVEATPGVVVPIVDFTKSRRNLASIPMATILSLVDHVNSTSFEGASAGKVLYFGPSSLARITAGGYQNFEIAHRFQYHPYGHNKFLRPSSGTFEDIVTKNGAKPPHPEGDLNALFI
jgi:hypothetical protein